MYIFVFIYSINVSLCVHVCSARLAAAAGTGDHCGQKEDSKKDVITGRELFFFSNASNEKLYFILTYFFSYLIKKM